MLSCGDGEAVEPNNDVASNDSIPQEQNDSDVSTEYLLVLRQDGILVKFCLLNERGDTTRTFAEGENIILDLTIINNRDKPLLYGPPQPFGLNTFRIFSKGGMDMGIPWIYYEDWPDNLYHLEGGGMLHYQCPWYGDTPHLPHLPVTKDVDTPHLTEEVYTALVSVNFYDVPEITGSLDLCILK